jgi:hypothetical protein
VRLHSLVLYRRAKWLYGSKSAGFGWEGRAASSKRGLASRATEAMASVLQVYCEYLAFLVARSSFDVPVNELHGGGTGGVIDESSNSTSTFYESFETIQMYLDAPSRTVSGLLKGDLLAIPGIRGGSRKKGR